MKKHILLAFASALLLSFPYISNFPGFVLFVGFIPLFIIEKYFFEQKRNNKPVVFFNYAYLTFALWNLFTLWWTVNSSWFSILPPLLLNSFFSAVLFLIFHIAHRNMPEKFAYATFVFFWLGFEYMHHNWFLSFPWLTLGNGLANNIEVIQWYEFTGVLGGSFWILLVNVLFFRIYRLFMKFKTPKALILEIIGLILLISLPVVLSQKIKSNFNESSNTIKIAVLQPNIDSYTEKYNSKMLIRNFEKTKTMISKASGVDYIVTPETAIPRNLEIIWEENFYESKSMKEIHEIMNRKAQTNLILGINSFSKAKENEAGKATVKFDKHTNTYYKSYSTAVQLNSSTKVQKYHKSKLVLGVEKMPFANLFPQLDNLMVDFGGIVGSLATDKQRKVFTTVRSSAKVGVPICYETLFGEFVSQFVRNNANILFVITNDGWWGDTPGYRQHNKLSQLRAIENRRSIARAANTGISCFITPLGEIKQASNYNQEIILTNSLSLNEELTYYTRFGDYIGRIALFFSGLFLLYLTIQIKTKKD